jgi:hypothetical protein
LISLDDEIVKAKTKQISKGRFGRKDQNKNNRGGIRDRVFKKGGIRDRVFKIGGKPFNKDRNSRGKVLGKRNFIKRFKNRNEHTPN